VKRLITWLVGAPLALVVILLSVANRGAVVFSLDPFSLDDPTLALEAPLFVLLFAAAFVGLMIGWGVTWASRLSRRRRADDAGPRPAATGSGGPVRALLPRP
jgi:uncharacterized integral membrane protein